LRAAKLRTRNVPQGNAALLRREALRVLCALVLYLACEITGVRAPLHHAYTALVMDAASAVLPWLQHFPTGPMLGNLRIRNLEVPVILLGCLFLVSTRIPLRARAVRFGSAFALLFVVSVAAAAAWSEAQATVDLQKSRGILLYLPWEFRVLDAIKYLLYDFGMEVSTFVMLALTVAWNAPELANRFEPRLLPRARRPRIRAGAFVIGVSVVVFALLFSWTRVRESIPAHNSAHGQFGDLFLQAGNKTQAEAQYRAAVQGETREAGPWLQLAALLRNRGATSEADLILRRGLTVVTGGDERRRLQEALTPPLQNP
jgi:hypothetical protein